MPQVTINDTPRPVYTDEPIVVNTPATYARQPVYDETAGARAAATNNLTWAIALVLVIAAIAIAIVFVAHNVSF